jgi:hypothetical protein
VKRGNVIRQEPLFAFKETAMQQIYPVIRNMTWEETPMYGCFSSGKMMDYQGGSYRLGAGASDCIYVFKSGVTMYVLVINDSLDYLGFDAYMPNEEDPIDNIFLQGGWAIRECLGCQWRELSPATIADRLMHHFS